ncbi:MAG: DUF5615 family PIN-like protein [Planctomycetota bacterium]
MRLKVDENLPDEIADQLREAGHDAMNVWQQEMQGVTDDRLVEVCRRERRAILTLDLDFTNITRYPPAELPGVIVLRLGQQSRHQARRAVSRLIGLLPEDGINGQLWIVGETNLRRFTPPSP